MQDLLPIVIHFESSGHGSVGYPIEIGYITSAGATWCSLIMPLPEWQDWDKDLEKVHFIKRELLINHGREIAVVVSRLNEVLRGKTVYSDNLSRDATCLKKLLDATQSTALFKLESINAITTQAQRKYWSQARHAVKGKVDLSRHRASMDAKFVQLTWAEAKKMAEESA